uniref:interleukin-12 subunit beta-like n=1 Tax=Pristiophorus japonicus TaxID=55135 RepID=UPI00398E65E1
MVDADFNEFPQAKAGFVSGCSRNHLLQKMWSFSLRLLISIAMLGCCSALDRYPENLVTVERTENITLSCEASPHSAVTWQQDGKPLQASRQLTLENVDQPLAGNYTCWQNGSLVKHTYLVISEKDQSPIFLTKEVQCRAKTLNGVITCKWKTHDAAIFNVTYGRSNSSRESDCKCNSTDYSNAGTDHEFTFTEQNYSPYAEEYSRIIFIVEAVNSVSYQKLKTMFFTEDIVKPDLPQNITVTLKNRKKLNVSWQYPCNWIKPHSYFPLVFAIEYKKYGKKHGKTFTVMEEGLNISEIRVPSSAKYEVRIRTKDRFLNSPWSEWSDWIKSRSKKKGKKTKQGPSRQHY